jgi:hypothetical protein
MLIGKFTQFQLLARVHGEDLNCRTANRSPPDDHRASPDKMLGPALCSRVVKLGHFPTFRINSGDIAPVVEVAINARQRQVAFVVCATMLPRNNVLNLQGAKGD